MSDSNHLLSSPANAKRLRQAVQELQQPAGVSRDGAEGRIARQLDQLAHLPDASMTTIFLGDLRKLAGR